MPKDLRSFLHDVVTERPGELLVVDREVDPRFGITAWGARYDADGEYPALLFTDVAGRLTSCATNLTATHGRMGLALGIPEHQLATTSIASSKQDEKHPPVVIDAGDAPVKQVIITGDAVDLGQLPIPTHNHLDGGPFLTAAVTVMRDPEGGALNAGVYRHHVYDDRHMGVWFFGSHHGGVIHSRYTARGEPTPFAIAIGHHPAFLMGAVSRVPGIGGEYDAAGAFLGESVRLTAAETSDLLVPADAEIILEGVILFDELREEGPFAEWPGHFVGGGPKPVMRIDCITRREDAIFQDIQASGREHRLIGALPRIASVHRNVAQVVPGVTSVNVPLHTRMHCYVSIAKTNDGDPTRAAFAALNTEPENFRMIVVVDDDIDVYDEREVSWAIGTRFDAEHDLQIIPRWNGPGGLLPTNWSYDAEGNRDARMSSAVIVDATKPAPPVVFPERAKVPDEYVAATDKAQTRAVTLDDLPWESTS